MTATSSKIRFPGNLEEAVRELQCLREDLKISEKNSVKLRLELDQLSYAVSHDLRAPLRAIEGFSAMLLEDYSETLDDQGKRYLQVVRDNSHKLNDYIEALLELTRINRRALHHVELDMNTLFAAVCANFTASSTDRRIDFQIETLPSAWGDRDMIHEIIVELVGNAVKFTRFRATPIIRIRGEIIGEEHRYIVNDNGVGFDMQYADKLFTIFQKLHGQEISDGTGAGLARVRRIVERHGGQTGAEGRTDEGATFFFTLPGCGNAGSGKDN